MLNFRSTTLLFSTLLMLVILSAYIYNISLLWVAPLIVIYLLLLAYGSFTISSGFYVKSYCAGKPAGKKIALSFDDGPDGAITPAILDLLKEKEISASFFLTGKNIEKNKNIVSRIEQEGHLIGNHSYSHSNLYDFYSAKQMTLDLLSVENLIHELTGRKTKLFRPPYGVTNPAVRKSAKSMDYDVIGWSIRSLDTHIIDKTQALRRITRKLHSGAIVLLHDTQSVNLELLPELIDIIHAKGYEIIRLDRLLDIPPYK